MRHLARERRLYFTAATSELSLDDETPHTPLEWLRDGGDEATVVALAAAHDTVP